MIVVAITLAVAVLAFFAGVLAQSCVVPECESCAARRKAQTMAAVREEES